ncbi:hypothetical protein DFJ43DRAFT_1036750 [Lentinula guzmanii]|uniref:Uncharacterized protein n=1 Tax=Lentinula guzmanii TaxID=2804957 RepID=A0AA38JNQ3_9AGAR|nr:hypothetical protein DFJ43DRAFT_1036750 [Lentinula guzmanii]
MPRPSSLSSAQSEVISAYFPTWEALLIKHKLQFGKDRSEKDPTVVSRWVTDTTTSILKTEPFKSVNYTVKTQKHWENLIATAFKNHQNNNLVAQTLKALGEKAHGEAEGHPVTVPHHMPKAIFKTENKDAIKELAERQCTAEPGLNPEKAYQALLTELWAQADWESFIAKAKEVDVFENQTLFWESVKEELLDQLNCLNAHHVFNEHNPIPAFLSTPEERQLADTLDDAWHKYCKKILVKHVKPEAQITPETFQADDPNPIEYNVFTDQNFIDFLFPNIAILLNDIWARPGDFPNIKAFGKECARIATVEDLDEDVARLYQFATYLSSVSNANMLLFVTALPKSPKPVSSVEKAAENASEAPQTSIAPEISEVSVNVAASDILDAIVIHAGASGFAVVDASDSQNAATLVPLPPSEPEVARSISVQEEYCSSPDQGASASSTSVPLLSSSANPIKVICGTKQKVGVIGEDRAQSGRVTRASATQQLGQYTAVAGTSHWMSTWAPKKRAGQEHLPILLKKQKTKGWSDFITKPNGKTYMVNADDQEEGRVVKHGDEAILIDKQGNIVSKLPCATLKLLD